jgi:hypothetical protein
MICTGFQVFLPFFCGSAEENKFFGIAVPGKLLIVFKRGKRKVIIFISESERLIKENVNFYAVSGTLIYSLPEFSQSSECIFAVIRKKSGGTQVSEFNTEP